MTAKEFLNRGFKIGKRIESVLEEVRRLDALTKSVTAVYGTEAVSRSRQTDSRENNIMRLMQAKAELEGLVDEMIRVEREIRRVTAAVPDVDCRLVLEFRYLNMNTWPEIQLKLEKSKTQIHRIHNAALKMAGDVLAAEGGEGNVDR